MWFKGSGCVKGRASSVSGAGVIEARATHAGF